MVQNSRAKPNEPAFGFPSAASFQPATNTSDTNLGNLDSGEPLDNFYIDLGPIEYIKEVYNKRGLNNLNFSDNQIILNHYAKL